MTLFADLGSSHIIFLGVVIVMTLFLLMRTSRYFTRPKSPEPSWSSVGRKPRPSGDRSEHVPQEMAGWEVEMHEFVREIKAELDSKMRALQAVIADADRAAERLETALHGKPNAAFSPASTVSRETRTAEEETPILKFRETPKNERHGIDLSNLPSSQVESLSPSGVPHPEHSTAQSKKEEIYMYADYGMTPAEIASRVGHPIGEVELILSLRRKK